MVICRCWRRQSNDEARAKNVQILTNVDTVIGVKGCPNTPILPFLTLFKTGEGEVKPMFKKRADFVNAFLHNIGKNMDIKLA